MNKNFRKNGLIFAITGLIVVGLGFLLYFIAQREPVEFLPANDKFSGVVSPWYEPSRLKVPAVVFRTKNLATMIKPTHWNLQIRVAGNGVLREIMGQNFPFGELIWDGMDSKGEMVDSDLGCQAILTIQDDAQGYQLFTTSFRTGIGFKPVDNRFEAMLGKMAYPLPTDATNPSEILGDDDVARINQLAVLLQAAPSPILTILASGRPAANSKSVDTTLAMKRAAFVRRILQDNHVNVSLVQLSMLPDNTNPATDVRIIIDSETVQALLAAKSKN